MRRPPDIPTSAGVFALVNDKAKHVYVNKARNLKERAIIWSSWLDGHDATGARIKVKRWPHALQAVSDDWEFRCTADPGVTVKSLQDVFVRAGYEIIQTSKTLRSSARLYIVDGVEATLYDHCRRRRIVNWPAVYKRVQRGMTPEAALNFKR